MTLSDGINTEGNGAVEGVVSKNISIIIIDDKADSLLDTANTNVTSLNSANNNNNDKNNDSMVPSGTVIKNDGILEELEEAIENAAISGEVILLSPPGNRTDSTMPPLIIIENVADTSRLVTMMNKFNDTIEESIPKMDQEIAQSQNHLRLDRENYKDDGDSENVEDLIAIAEYEPQRIDATRAEDENPQPLSGKNRLYRFYLFFGVQTFRYLFLFAYRQFCFLIEKALFPEKVDFFSEHVIRMLNTSNNHTRTIMSGCVHACI